jgi:hypothetical protein
MQENMFETEPEKLCDLEVNCGASKVKVWFAPREVGLELSFKRVTWSELAGILAIDRARAQEQGWKPLLPEWWSQFVESPMPRDNVGARVMDWAVDRCLDEEQRIPLLNFENMAVYANGRLVRVRNGVLAGGLFVAYNFLEGRQARLELGTFAVGGGPATS